MTYSLKKKHIFSSQVSTPNAVLHFDGKMLNDFYAHKHENRLAVIITQSKEGQLLGVPVIESECAIDVSEAVHDLIVEWGIVRKIKAVCADTTAVNTGRFNGAISRLEHRLSYELLYLACRHHVYELALRAAFECKFGPTTGRDVPLFASFKKKWHTLDHSKLKPGVKSIGIYLMNVLPSLCSTKTFL